MYFREIRLNLVTVKNNIELKRFSGKGERTVLESIEYTSGFLSSDLFYDMYFFHNFIFKML